MPSNTTSRTLFYTYVLESGRDGRRYIGFTADIKRRLGEHMRGESFATASRRPLHLVYFEACLCEADAKRREHYLKTTQGRRFLGLRLQEYKRNFPALGARS